MAFKAKFTNKHETILWWTKPGGVGEEPVFDVFPVREATKFHDSRNNLFGRNPGNVWEVDRVAFGSTEQTSHIAVFPEEISDRIVLATTREGDIVLDPFSGSGTVCKMAKARGRHFIGCEISPLYQCESIQRVSKQAMGEFLSVMSEIQKEHILEEGKPMTLDAAADKTRAMLTPLSLKPYESMIGRAHMDALCAGIENGVTKSDKMSLWKALDELLPPADSECRPKDPSGLLSLVDGAYLRAYRLHKAFSSAMRFHRAAVWIDTLLRCLRSRRGAMRGILIDLATSETGSYAIHGDRITLLARDGRLRRPVDESQAITQTPDVVPSLLWHD